MPTLPANTQRVIPYLYYKNGKAAIEFIAKAFGFDVRQVVPGPGNLVMHAELGYRDAVVYLGTPEGQPPAKQLPKRNAGVLVYVDDVDAHFAHAKAAGAKILDAPADQFYGDRTYRASDPEGQEWMFLTHLRDVTPAEIAAAMASMSAPAPKQAAPKRARSAAAKPRAKRRAPSAKSAKKKTPGRRR